MVIFEQITIYYSTVILINSSFFYLLVLAKGGCNVKATIAKLARKPSVQSFSRTHEFIIIHINAETRREILNQKVLYT